MPLSYICPNEPGCFFMLLDIILSVMPLHYSLMARTFGFPMGKALGILDHLLSPPPPPPPPNALEASVFTLLLLTFLTLNQKDKGHKTTGLLGTYRKK